LEACSLQRVERGERGREAEEALGGEEDQGFGAGLAHLAAQEVEVLGGGGYVADLDVFVGAELEVALDSCAGVFRALAFVAVG